MRAFLPILLLLLAASPAAACFGPKLYLGTGEGGKADILFAIVSLYIKEKTGTETVRVPLAGKEPLAELRGERLDLAFIDGAGGDATVLLAVPEWPALAAGRRPLEELQFSTVPAAMKRLQRVLTAAHLQALQAQVAAGETPLAAARRLFAAQGWL